MDAEDEPLFLRRTRDQAENEIADIRAAIVSSQKGARVDLSRIDLKKLTLEEITKEIKDRRIVEASSFTTDLMGLLTEGSESEFVQRCSSVAEWLFTQYKGEENQSRRSAILDAIVVVSFGHRWDIPQTDLPATDDHELSEHLNEIYPNEILGSADSSATDRRFRARSAVVTRLSQMRATHQFSQMRELIAAWENVEHMRFRNVPVLMGLDWFADLANGSKEVDSRQVERAKKEMSKYMSASPEAMQLVLNGFFLAPTGENLSPELHGSSVIEIFVQRTTILSPRSVDRSGNPISVDTPMDEIIAATKVGGATAYFLARAYREIEKFDYAHAAIGEAFRGLSYTSRANVEMLMSQYEREREAIIANQQLVELRRQAESAEESANDAAEQLRSENATLIATFTGFFAFAFGALALFFRDQGAPESGAAASGLAGDHTHVWWELMLRNVAILAPAGLILIVFVVATHYVFSYRTRRRRLR